MLPPSKYPLTLLLPLRYAVVMATILYTVTFRDGTVKPFRTLNGAIRATRPGAVVRTAKGQIVNVTYGAGRKSR